MSEKGQKRKKEHQRYGNEADVARWGLERLDDSSEKRREGGERGGGVDKFGSRFTHSCVFVSPFKEPFMVMSVSWH